AAEVLQETERVQKALIGAVSHDLRTPLASIKVAASTLRTPGLSIAERDRVELVETIDTEADRLSRLVTNLLDVSRVQAGVLVVRSQPVAVVDLVHETLDGLRPMLVHRAVSVQLSEGLPLLDIDHVLVGQALANLVDNAVRHSPEGSAIDVGARLRDDCLVELSVRDRGPGVAAAERARIFDLFYRTGPGEGSGVGLAIAKAFVEAHGQRIWVDDADGGGAIFRFTLPTVALDVEHG
ncbi:MAG TPA: ATP-binding protein, partial [Acidimicrobiales bacterium]|nr:ATP-binding protein [Acidimicrobiales bacterium]